MRAIFLVIFLALSCAAAPSSAATPGEVPVGGFLREATLNGLFGKTKKFSDYRGKPLVINVWASWCSPCRSEMGSLNRLHRKYGGKQFNVIGISTDDYPVAAKAFIKESKTKFDNFIDSKVFLENMLGANMIPVTLLVDAEGRILDKVHGAQEWDSPQVVEYIGRAFKLTLNSNSQ